MRYTVWSQGQEIGETELGFCRLFKCFRLGWFHPNAAGEKLMPVIDALWPAIFACLHRDRRVASGQRSELPGSRAFAEAAEALARAESLDLELRREDGSVVPTASIGLRGCPEDLELEDAEITDWTLDDDLEEAELCNALDELAREEGLEGPARLWESEGWKSEESENSIVFSGQEELSVANGSGDPALARYQIQVLLDDDDLIP